METTSEQANILRTRSTSYFVRHWRGELSLPISFWANTFLGNTALLTASLLLADGNMESFSASWKMWIFVIFFATVIVWQTVGTWRSAGEHPLRGGSWFWAGAARVVITINALGAILDITKFISM